MTRHTFATKSPGKPIRICQCPECRGRIPVALCPFTREMFKPDEMIPDRVRQDAPAEIQQRTLDLED